MTSQDIAEIHAAANRLKVSNQVQNMVANMDSDQVKSAVAQLQDQNEELIEIPEDKAEHDATDECQCVEYSQCSEDKMDFTFGKSCSFGKVRCCKKALETTTTTMSTIMTEKSTPISMATKSPSKTFIRYSVPAMIEKTPQILSLNAQQLAEKVKKNSRPLMYNHGVMDQR